MSRARRAFGLAIRGDDIRGVADAGCSIGCSLRVSGPNGQSEKFGGKSAKPALRSSND